MGENILSKSVALITENALCTACGGCAGICPVHAIIMEQNAAGFVIPQIDEDKCLNCSKCLKICPSNGERLGKDFIGKTINGYLGYATDTELRMKSQSGGIVTALLRYFIENDIIDAAIVTRFNCSSRRSESFLATTVDEINSAKGSHYTQTSPVELILQNQDKRLAAVLLGCQTSCLNLISEKYKNIKLPIITIGLICGGNLSGLMVDELLKQGKLQKNEQLKSFRFRDKEHGGWPGNIMIQTDRLIQLPKEKRMELKQYYQNYRCLLCAEKMNQNCDLVVGDPWGIPIVDEEQGYSAVITRTERGEKALQEAKAAGYLYLQDEKIEKIISGQKIETDLAKRHKITQAISMYQSWRYPYILGECKEFDKSSEADLLILKKMQYTRKLQLSKTINEAINIINLKKKEECHPLKEWLYSIKERIFG